MDEITTIVATAPVEAAVDITPPVVAPTPPAPAASSVPSQAPASTAPPAPVPLPEVPSLPAAAPPAPVPAAAPAPVPAAPAPVAETVNQVANSAARPDTKAAPLPDAGNLEQVVPNLPPASADVATTAETAAATAKAKLSDAAAGVGTGPSTPSAGLPDAVSDTAAALDAPAVVDARRAVSVPTPDVVTAAHTADPVTTAAADSSIDLVSGLAQRPPASSDPASVVSPATELTSFPEPLADVTTLPPRFVAAGVDATSAATETMAPPASDGSPAAVHDPFGFSNDVASLPQLVVDGATNPTVVVTAGLLTLAGVAAVGRGPGLAGCLSGAQLVFTHVRLIPCLAAQSIGQSLSQATSAAIRLPSRALPAPLQPPVVEAGPGGGGSVAFDDSGPASSGSAVAREDGRLMARLGAVLAGLYAAFLAVWFSATRLRWNPRH